MHYCIHKCPPTVPILSQLDPFHTTTSHILKIHHNIIRSSTPGTSKWSLPHRFPHHKPVYASRLSHTRYLHQPSDSSRFGHSKTIGRGEQTITLLVMKFSLFPFYLVHLMPKNYSQHPILKHPQPKFHPKFKRPTCTHIKIR